ERVDGVFGDPLDTLLAMNVREHLPDLVAEHAREGQPRGVDGDDLHTELAQRGRHLRADEAEADHDRAAAARGRRADAITVLDRPELEHAGQIRARHREGAVTPAGGHQQAVVGDALAALELDELLLWGDRRPAHAA